MTVSYKNENIEEDSLCVLNVGHFYYYKRTKNCMQQVHFLTSKVFFIKFLELISLLSKCSHYLIFLSFSFMAIKCSLPSTLFTLFSLGKLKMRCNLNHHHYKLDAYKFLCAQSRENLEDKKWQNFMISLKMSVNNWTVLMMRMK